MDEKQLFAMALGLSEPWYIERIEFDPEKKRLDLFWGQRRIRKKSYAKEILS